MSYTGMSISAHVHPAISGFITDSVCCTFATGVLWTFVALLYMNHFKVTKTNKKKMQTTPFFIPCSTQKTHKNNPNPNSSLQNIQTIRICSLEICPFKISPSGNCFCQMQRAETKQILTNSCSLLVLKSKAK